MCVQFTYRNSYNDYNESTRAKIDSNDAYKPLLLEGNKSSNDMLSYVEEHVPTMAGNGSTFLEYYKKKYPNKRSKTFCLKLRTLL